MTASTMLRHGLPPQDEPDGTAPDPAKGAVPLITRGGAADAVYDTFDRAAHRVEILKRSGIWPGIICRRDGGCQLTYDPGDDPAQRKGQP